MGVEHRAFPLGGAYRHLQLGQHHPANALGARRRHDGLAPTEHHLVDVLGLAGGQVFGVEGNLALVSCYGGLQAELERGVLLRPRRRGRR